MSFNTSITGVDQGHSFYTPSHMRVSQGLVRTGVNPIHEGYALGKLIRYGSLYFSKMWASKPSVHSIRVIQSRHCQQGFTECAGHLERAVVSLTKNLHNPKGAIKKIEEVRDTYRPYLDPSEDEDFQKAQQRHFQRIKHRIDKIDDGNILDNLRGLLPAFFSNPKWQPSCSTHLALGVGASLVTQNPLPLALGAASCLPVASADASSITDRLRECPIDLANPQTFLRKRISYEEGLERMALLEGKQEKRALSEKDERELEELSTGLLTKEKEILIRRTDKTQYYFVQIIKDPSHLLTERFRRIDFIVNRVELEDPSIGSKSLFRSYRLTQMLQSLDAIMDQDFLNGLKNSYMALVQLLPLEKYLSSQPKAIDAIHAIRHQFHLLYEEHLNFNRVCEQEIGKYLKELQTVLKSLCQQLNTSCKDSKCDLLRLQQDDLDRIGKLLSEKTKISSKLYQTLESSLKKYLDQDRDKLTLIEKLGKDLLSEDPKDADLANRRMMVALALEQLSTSQDSRRARLQMQVSHLREIMRIPSSASKEGEAGVLNGEDVVNQLEKIVEELLLMRRVLNLSLLQSDGIKQISDRAKLRSSEIVKDLQMSRFNFDLNKEIAIMQSIHNMKALLQIADFEQSDEWTCSYPEEEAPSGPKRQLNSIFAVVATCFLGILGWLIYRIPFRNLDAPAPQPRRRQAK